MRSWLRSKARADDPEDRDEYLAERVFWVPKEARWTILQDNAKQPTIGNLIDDAMVAIERDNPIAQRCAAGQLRARHAGQAAPGRPGGPDQQRSTSSTRKAASRISSGGCTNISSRSSPARKGKKGGEFYTPRSVVRVLVEMLAPYKGRVFDPCCGSGGMFVQSEKFVEAHGGRIGDICASTGRNPTPTPGSWPR